MTDSHDALLSRLVEHCLGDSNPSMALVSEGRFPKNWASRYLALLERASKVWKDAEAWPRQLVGCLHFVSQLLPIRYEVWKRTHYAGNSSTERQLGRVCGVSAVFLIGGIAGREVEGVDLEGAADVGEPE